MSASIKHILLAGFAFLMLLGIFVLSPERPVPPRTAFVVSVFPEGKYYGSSMSGSEVSPYGTEVSLLAHGVTIVNQKQDGPEFVYRVDLQGKLLSVEVSGRRQERPEDFQEQFLQSVKNIQEHRSGFSWSE